MYEKIQFDVRNLARRSVVSVSIAAGLALSLSACGDDVTEVTEVHQDGMAVLAAGEKLDSDACDKNHAGDTVYVTDSTAAFVCDGKSWQTMKGSDGKDGENAKNGEKSKDSDDAGLSCSSKQIEKKGRTGFVLSCDGAVVDTIWNGVDGAKGEPGKSAEDGTSCTAAKITFRMGAKVSN